MGGGGCVGNGSLIGATNGSGNVANGSSSGSVFGAAAAAVAWHSAGDYLYANAYAPYQTIGVIGAGAGGISSSPSAVTAGGAEYGSDMR